MQATLNSEQSKGLANLFFDVAKGMLLGTVGFAVFVPSEVKLLVSFFNLLVAYGCIRFALSLLEEVNQ